MDMRTYLNTVPKEDALRLAAAVNSSLNYLRLIAYKQRQAGPGLAKRLVAADSRLTLAELRPDIWGSNEQASAEHVA